MLRTSTFSDLDSSFPRSSLWLWPDTQRAEIVSGKVEPTEEEVAAGAREEDGPKIEEVKEEPKAEEKVEEPKAEEASKAESQPESTTSNTAVEAVASKPQQTQKPQHQNRF